MYRGVPVQALPAFRALSAQQAQALLEQLDQWLQNADSGQPNGTDAPPGARVGLGIYYFEELPSDPVRHPGEPT
jgi:hypothetical protein